MTASQPCSGEGIHCINVLKMADMIRERMFQKIHHISTMVSQSYQNYDIQSDGMTKVSFYPYTSKALQYIKPIV